MSNQDDVHQIRSTGESDAEAIAECVNRAYEHYTSRIGSEPGPMAQDYHQVVRDHEVFVATAGDKVLGVLVLVESLEGFLLDNVAVSPQAQGRGIGCELLQLAETRAKLAGYASIYLYTNEKMTENQALYARIGYREYDRRTEHGLSRVYMRKRLPDSGL